MIGENNSFGACQIKQCRVSDIKKINSQINKIVGENDYTYTFPYFSETIVSPRPLLRDVACINNVTCINRFANK